jgi:hypothetical protein
LKGRVFAWWYRARSLVKSQHRQKDNR